MFAPKWKKDALHLAKGARKFVNYKRDLLKQERLVEIESRRDDLLAAIKTKDAEKVAEASKFLRAECENALPREKPLGWLEENVEVLFVAIVIALGLRAYYLQPFRIPTGSMQPTLNGITGHKLPKEQWPSFPQRVMEKLLRGRSYVFMEMDRDRRVVGLADKQMFHFFSRAEIRFEDSRPNFFSRLLGTDPLRLPAPLNPLSNAGFGKAMEVAGATGGVLPKGTTLCEGYIDAGDLVLVNKFSYHFRKPKRGEVFVFDTIGIKGIHDRSREQAAGSHYIKRLCGVPGDTLSISPPHLLIDGKIAREPGIRRVAEAQGEYGDNDGYALADPSEANNHPKPVSVHLTKPSDTLELAGRAASPGMREYAALGDNTSSSLDSRYWGPVKEFNLVGPALFSLWPITTGHWGLID
ncbi:MAG: signal peptidase I [Verrucomicrobiota bacterium]